MVQTSGNHDVRYSSASNRLWIACEWGRGKGRTEGRWKEKNLLLLSNAGGAAYWILGCWEPNTEAGS
ncbi:hypothetical protein BDB00DRAFT_835570 [Zychaea mexicana]|uniref:uncharacterized protein n=1 Tax=Zychaea mexicana TaxID=64656 RepID=UPI0022FE1CF1|nr:uncharacterized protein BDB00DRAFT_835570 [Zychaea mexicana]KAI9490998.1 hypothetical protein BDB00DRAFT_835570 [Zychaea mexicana]